MDKVIVVKNFDGGVSVIIPSSEMFNINSCTRLELAEKNILKGASDDEILNWIITKDVPKGAKYRIVDKGKIPSDRTFRNAWTDDNPTETVDVDVDMDKARAIHLDKIRVERNKKLVQLDIEYRKASGNTAKQAEIDAKAQALRDLTQNFNLSVASSPDELKNLWPNELV